MGPSLAVRVHLAGAKTGSVVSISPGEQVTPEESRSGCVRRWGRLRQDVLAVLFYG